MPTDPLIAERMALLDVSGIRRVFELAAELTDPIDLSIGQPDFPVPEPVKRAAVEAIETDKNAYTLTQGIAPLREAVAEQLRLEFGWNDPDLLVTSGTSGALLLAFMATLNAGEEVVIPDPYFVMYKHLPCLVGGAPVMIDTYPDFHLDPDKIEAAITQRTKIIILCSPSNPTGVVGGEDEIKAVCQLANKHGLLVISDEIYNLFCYQPHVSAGPYAEKLLLLRGFSKSYAMTGWRMGYAAGPKTLIEQMTKLQQYTFVCAPSMAQWAALAALETDMGPRIDHYHRKRDLVYEGLKDRFGLVKSGGAFYLFPPAPGGDASKFCEAAVKNNVLLIPGSVFSEQDTHFRLSYATSDEKLRQGVAVLNKMADQFDGKG